MPSQVIRAATIDDIPCIVNVRLSALSDGELRGFTAPEFATFTSTDTLRRAWDRSNMLKDGDKVFVAEDEGKVVGYIVFQVGRNSGYIDNVGVAKKN